MLSRVAERIYWMSRYLERAENTARVVDVANGLLLDLPAGAGFGWRQIVSITGTEDAFEASGAAPTGAAMIHWVLAEPANPSSLLASISLARENVRTTRDIAPAEAWRGVNELHRFARDRLPRAAAQGNRQAVLHEVIGRCQQINGLMAGCMSHGPAYQFLRMGRHLERADMTTRTIDVAAALLMSGGRELVRYDNTLWMGVLRSLSAYQMYRQYVRRRIEGGDVIAFLLQDRHFPRSVAWCLAELRGAASSLPRNAKPAGRAEQLIESLGRLEPRALDAAELHERIDALQVEFAAVHDAIAAAWFLPLQEG